MNNTFNSRIVITYAIGFNFLFTCTGYTNLIAQAPVKQNLNGTWKIAWTDRIICDNCFKAFDYQRNSSAYSDVPVPMDLNLYMQQINLADDPNIGLNALRNRWIGEQYYQYYTSFEVSGEADTLKLNQNNIH